MIRGTTPTLEFKIPFDVGLIDELSIAFSQNSVVVLDKSLIDCTTNGQTIILKLSQIETLKLRAGTRTEIQVRVRIHDGTALASKIISVQTDRILKDGEI